MSEKLQKIIAGHGITSRRKAELLIEEGRVSINGRTATLGDRADADADRICVDGIPVGNAAEHIYYVLNKPKGVITSMNDEKGRRDLREFTGSISTRVFPVGRLDMDSSGLLILTNDGEFAYSAAHPSKMTVKSYFVRVKNFSEDALEKLRGELYIDSQEIKADFVYLIRDDSTSAALLIGIHQGLNRQVRRMCAMCGMEVLTLTRVAEGGLELGDLPVGEMRRISIDEANKVFFGANTARLIDTGGMNG